MTMRTVILCGLLIAAPAAAQPPASPSPTPPADPAPAAAIITGSIAPGIVGVSNDTNSSKLSEYRDLREDAFVARATLGIWDAASGWQAEFVGANLGRDDQSLFGAVGRPGRWRLSADWGETPHRYSNKAVTPYIRRAPGLFEVPATIPIGFKRLATGPGDVAGVLASDALIAAYQSTYLAPTPLGTQTNTGRFALNWSAAEAWRFDAIYDRLDKSGLKSTFGPIGDRPPRTLNVQLTEPVDYRTNDLTFATEHHASRFQVRGEYLFSDFANRVDTLRWQNLYTTAAPGADFDVWDRLVATSGARPLPPDNRYHLATGTLGVDLPRDSRLTTSVAYGRLEQNETLLPYATPVAALAVQTLPRTTAEALMHTRHVSADYVIAPAPRLQLRAFFREYAIDNDTPSDRWQYVTSDTANLNGTVNYVNKRVNLAYGWDRQHGGAEAIWRLPGVRSTLTVGVEREAIGREFREADTTETVLRVGWRVRPARGMSVQARFTEGARDGGTYHNTVTHEGYWYTAAEAADNNNPGFTFDNHPDMRRYDVSDRRRRQVDVTVNTSAGDLVGVTAFVRYRSDDYDSDVASSQPLLGTGLAEQAAATPGDQLGLIDTSRLRYGLDVFYQPTPRATLNAFLNLDRGASFARSLEFNENNKQNPSAVATASLGPWTRASSQWTADTDDDTWSGGFGATLHLVPERLVLVTDYTLSLASIDIAYGGFGLTNFTGEPFPANHEFAFSPPPTIREDLHAVNVRLEIPIRTVWLLLGYGFEHYRLDDWQQSGSQPWVEPVGAETLLRDTSRSHQWGNRLFNLGTYLAPSYDAHVGFVGFRYRF